MDMFSPIFFGSSLQAFIAPAAENSVEQMIDVISGQLDNIFFIRLETPAQDLQMRSDNIPYCILGYYFLNNLKMLAFFEKQNCILL